MYVSQGLRINQFYQFIEWKAMSFDDIGVAFFCEETFLEGFSLESLWMCYILSILLM
jgi:competence transcription factor ComK